MGTAFSRGPKKEHLEVGISEGRVVATEDKVFQTEGKAKGSIRNFVLLDIPPKYDLTLDSTDSEITELEQRARRKSSQSVEVATKLSALQNLQNPSDFREFEIQRSGYKSPPFIEFRPSREFPSYSEAESVQSEVEYLIADTNLDEEEIPPTPPIRKSSQLKTFEKDESFPTGESLPEPIVTERSDQTADTAHTRDLPLESEVEGYSQEYSTLTEEQSCECYCDCNCNCSCNCDCECTSSCVCNTKDTFSVEGLSLKDPNGVMPDYQRYSREAPEKDQADRTTMKECCRPSYNRNAQPKRNPPPNPNNPNIAPNNNTNNNNNNSNSNNRHLSDSYVSCRNLCPSAPSRTNPLNTQSNPHFESYQPPAPPRRLHAGEQRQLQARKGTPQAPQRSYPPGRREPERPHIPLPPPLHFSPPQPAVPEPRPEEEMYSHNTKRNYVSNKPYKPTHSYHRQPIKPYPYEEPGGSTTYSNESTCSNNCSGYDHCPMHQGCRCQCLCSSDREDRYPNCSQPAQEDELSCCSDSSNSEYMNLAYQRTGDYPELMDELENTLSYRNRLRVQKTMQRFEMLSRQNKNLEKPIFEDEESMHYVPGRRHKHHEHSECKCANCEERPRRQQYPSRNENLGKRANYQPTPFPRNHGYVEKVARYMDPNLNFQRRNNHNGKRSNGRGSNGQDLSTVTNSTGTWQMDPRKGEWVKVHPNAHNNGGGQNQYDFENNYPPLPPRPGSNNMYERRGYTHERGQCACAKCTRRQR